MVRENNNFDDSDSDWDSLALAAEPAPRNHAVSAKLGAGLVSDGEGNMANAPAASNDPLYSEIIRPNSNDRKGPLTFVDRRSNDKSVSSSVSTDSQQDSPVGGASAEIRHHRHNVDVEHVEVEIPEMLEKKRSPPFTAKSLRKLELSDDDEISQISSGRPSGFDNAAFSYQERNVNDGLKSAKMAAVEATPVVEYPRPDETIEIFTFDNANSGFYHVAEKRKRPKADDWNQRLFAAMSQFWAEITSVIGLPFIFILTLFLQLLRLATVGLLRPLLIGLFNGVSDGLIKPMLTVVYNAVVHPLGVFLYNVALCVKMVAGPLAEALLILTNPVARLLQSFRLVDISTAPKLSTV